MMDRLIYSVYSCISNEFTIKRTKGNRGASQEGRRNQKDSVQEGIDFYCAEQPYHRRTTVCGCESIHEQPRKGDESRKPKEGTRGKRDRRNTFNPKVTEIISI